MVLLHTACVGSLFCPFQAVKILPKFPSLRSLDLSCAQALSVKDMALLAGINNLQDLRINLESASQVIDLTPNSEEVELVAEPLKNSTEIDPQVLAAIEAELVVEEGERGNKNTQEVKTAQKTTKSKHKPKTTPAPSKSTTTASTSTPPPAPTHASAPVPPPHTASAKQAKRQSAPIYKPKAAIKPEADGKTTSDAKKDENFPKLNFFGENFLLKKHTRPGVEMGCEKNF